MTVTSTSAFFRRWAASIPPKPPPMITTRRRWEPALSADMCGLRPWRMSTEPLKQMVADSDPVGHGRERRVHRSDAGKEARVDYVQVVELVGLAVDVDHRARWVGSEPARPGLL